MTVSGGNGHARDLHPLLAKLRCRKLLRDMSTKFRFVIFVLRFLNLWINFFFSPYAREILRNFSSSWHCRERDGQIYIHKNVKFLHDQLRLSITTSHALLYISESILEKW